MAHARDRHQDAGQHMTWQRRHGRVATKPTPTVEGAVACDAVDSVAGHQGKPEAVAKRGGAGDADGSRARGDAARLPQRHHRVADDLAGGEASMGMLAKVPHVPLEP